MVNFLGFILIFASLDRQRCQLRVVDLAEVRHLGHLLSSSPPSEIPAAAVTVIVLLTGSRRYVHHSSAPPSAAMRKPSSSSGRTKETMPFPQAGRNTGSASKN